MSARRRERRRDLLHMDVSLHVFFIMHSASLGVFAFVCVFGVGGRWLCDRTHLTEAGKMVVRSVAVVIGRS